MALWIHQELSLIAFDLYPAHDNIVLHIHTHLLVCCLRALAVGLPGLPVEAVVLLHLVLVEGALRIVVVRVVVHVVLLLLLLVVLISIHVRVIVGE